MLVKVAEEVAMRPRHPQDFYPTDLDLCTAAVRRYLVPWVLGVWAPTHPGQTLRALDLGAGEGPWGVALRQNIGGPMALTGIELRDEHSDPPVRPHPIYDTWITGEFCQWSDTQPRESWDLIFGNPPYKINDAILNRTLQPTPDGPYGLLHRDGKMVFLLRLSYIGSQSRGRGIFHYHPMSRVDNLVGRPSFTGDGKTDTDEYAIFDWDGGCREGGEWLGRPWNWKNERPKAWGQRVLL